MKGDFTDYKDIPSAEAAIKQNGYTKYKHCSHFVFVEAVPCEVSRTSDGYYLKINKSGRYIKSDISLQLIEDSPEPSKVLYALKGKLNLKSEE
ncbi:MAG: hypothetical protein Q8N95_14570 [Desulfobacterales bacterium]|nr:hypothetical protein [Desulfobacterales bacterium]